MEGVGKVFQREHFIPCVSCCSSLILSHLQSQPQSGKNYANKKKHRAFSYVTKRLDCLVSNVLLIGHVQHPITFRSYPL